MADPAALDLIGLVVGSEGTLAIVTKAWVQPSPNPQGLPALRATFASMDDTCNTVSQIIAAGIIPAAMELMDQGIFTAVEAAFSFGFPPDDQMWQCCCYVLLGYGWSCYLRKTARLMLSLS